MTLEQRIERARGALAYAEKCERETAAMVVPESVKSILRADAVAVRESADAVLQALLAEFEGVKQ